MISAFKKISVAFIIAIQIFAVISVYAATPEATDLFYVNDYADVLSQETEDIILKRSTELYEKTGAQIVVLTVKSLDGKDISEFGLETARAWGIGTAGKDNGVLILLSTGDREVRIEVGYGLEGCINDAKAGRMIDTYATSRYRSGDYSFGTENLYNAVLNAVLQEYGLETIPGTPVYSDDIPLPDFKTGVGIVLLLIISLLFLWMFIWLLFLVGATLIYWVMRLVDNTKNTHHAEAFLPNLKICINPVKLAEILIFYRFRNRRWRSSGGSGSSRNRGGGGGFGGGGASRGF